MKTDHVQMQDIGPAHHGPPTPDNRRRLAWIVVAALVGVTLGTGVTALAYQDALRDRDAAAATLRSDSNASVAALGDRIDVLELRIAETTAEADRAARRLARANATLDAMVGPALPDGRHFGYLVAVGGSQAPPRVVFDLAQWFTDAEADAAAIADGAMPPGKAHIENGFYIRNESPRWRNVEVDPSASIALVTYPYGDIEHPREISLERFAEITDDDPTLVRWSPFWLDVRDGIVTGLDQQYIP